MTIIDRKHEKPRILSGKKKKKKNAKTPTNANNRVEETPPRKLSKPHESKD